MAANIYLTYSKQNYLIQIVLIQCLINCFMKAFKVARVLEFHKTSFKSFFQLCKKENEQKTIRICQSK